MPEGPEIELMAQWLEQRAVGRRIALIEALGRWESVDLRPLADRAVTGIGRWGKLHWLELDGEPPQRLVAWMGMSGRWTAERPKHPMLRVEFTDGSAAWIDDARRFGRIAVASPADVAALAERCKTSVVHDPAFAVKFAARAARDKRAICAVLLDQRIAAGVGNYIKCEALYATQTDPESRARETSVDRLVQIGVAARAVALASLAANGATFATHQTPGGEKTAVHESFAVYGKRTCPSGHPVERLLTSDGRSTHWCPTEQRAPTVSS